MIRKHDKRVLCRHCGKNPVKRIGRYVDGAAKYGILCPQCHRKQYTNQPKSNGYTYRQHKGDVCEQCGFVPENTRQLDVHHIDYNHKNNIPDNLRTLCANCHRLEHCN